MYNHLQSDQQSTRRRLLERTRAFHQRATVDDAKSLERFRRRWEDGSDVKLLTGLPSCPFLGFVDFDEGGSEEEATLVGCLVHPLQNDGIDGRDCGVYDRFICEDYLCASHQILGAGEKQLILDAVDDSYLYGLIVTNPKFVRHLLKLVAQRTGAWPTRRILAQPAVVDAARACFEEFRHWPYRGSDGIFGQVQVCGALETRRRRMPGDDFDVEEVPLDMLLVCMGTECDELDDLIDARRRMQRRLDALVDVVAPHIG